MERIMYNEQNSDSDREKRLKKMMYKILEVEKENLNTREKTREQMVEVIRKIIMDEANSRIVDNETLNKI